MSVDKDLIHRGGRFGCHLAGMVSRVDDVIVANPQAPKREQRVIVRHTMFLDGQAFGPNDCDLSVYQKWATRQI